MARRQGGEPGHAIDAQNDSLEFLPTRVLEVEISDELPGIAATRPGNGVRYGSALILVRLETKPLGVIRVSIPVGGLDSGLLADEIWWQLGEEIRASVPHVRGAPLDALPAGGVPSERHNGYARRRAALVEQAPPAAVVICTRDGPDSLRLCLEAVGRQDHPRYEVIVVDNAPKSNATASVVEGIELTVPVRRVHEPVPGLARARNCGIQATSASIVAFLDDDEVPDRHWLSELAVGFEESSDVGCVTGLILPALLETRAQAWFEEYGGHSKNRGFDQQTFDAADSSSQHPLYPLPPFGAGGNMAFRREAIIGSGGFDPALGAGTPTKGAEDTAAFADVMMQGYRLVYRPAALVWHNHYRDFSALRSQLFGYGSGLTTYFVRLVIRRPRLVRELARLAPRGLRDLFASDSQRFAPMRGSFPPELLAAHRRGMLWGLIAYPLTLWRQRSQPRVGFDPR